MSFWSSFFIIKYSIYSRDSKNALLVTHHKKHIYYRDIFAKLPLIGFMQNSFLYYISILGKSQNERIFFHFF